MVTISAAAATAAAAKAPVAMAASLGASSSEEGKPLVLDAHLHVWPSPDDHPYAPGKEPPASLAERSTAEALLERADAAGVHGALIVQPINLGFDHTYVADTIARYPGRFVGCCLADPTAGGGGEKELKRLLFDGNGGEGGAFRAVRFNPGLWPEGERMTNDVGKAMYRLAGERGAPVGFMCFHGLHLHVEDIKALCTEFPDTPVLMDHFGFCKGVDDPNWHSLLSLASFPQVSVKASAQFRVAPAEIKPEWPYPTSGPQLRQLIDAFGPGRVVWGSDFPFVAEQCGYERAAGIVNACGAELTPEERDAVMGGTLAAMFPGGWY